jgi:hypothetical protein
MSKDEYKNHELKRNKIVPALLWNVDWNVVDACSGTCVENQLCTLPLPAVLSNTLKALPEAVVEPFYSSTNIFHNVAVSVYQSLIFVNRSAGSVMAGMLVFCNFFGRK